MTRGLLVAATALCVFGVQLPTARWNRSNRIRTVISVVTMVLLLLVLVRLPGV